MIRFHTTFAFFLFIAVSNALAQGLPQVIVSEQVNQAFQNLEENLIHRFEALPPQPENDVEPQLINGIPVNPRDFPAVFRMTTGGTCTATVVGPAAILIAAHCVNDLQRIEFVTGGRSTAGICQHAPGYKSSPGESEDWSMCLLERDVSGFTYESVDLGQPPQIGARVVLMGYGCTVQGGPIDGLLRIGVSNVSAKPIATWPNEPSTIYTTSDTNAGEAVLCPGDSGGPLYRLIDGSLERRAIVGVNSRTNFVRNSLFAATGSRAGAAFLREWTERHEQMVCGINLTIGCQ